MSRWRNFRVESHLLTYLLTCCSAQHAPQRVLRAAKHAVSRRATFLEHVLPARRIEVKIIEAPFLFSLWSEKKSVVYVDAIVKFFSASAGIPPGQPVGGNTPAARECNTPSSSHCALRNKRRSPYHCMPWLQVPP